MKFFGFAGHGRSDPLETSKSGLKLKDNTLTVVEPQQHEK